jgi:transcriptional regulator with XRE-family HTH domain
MRTNVQLGIEQQRAVYETMPRPLLSQLAEVHRITVRDFADIFGISKSYAGELLNHKKFPTLELGIKIARYFEVSMEELFGWRVDDEGMRRPMMVDIGGHLLRLSSKNPDHRAIPLVMAIRKKMNENYEKWEEGTKNA